MFRKTGLAITASLLTLVVAQGAAAAEISAGKLKSLKADAVAGVESRAKLAQVMNDKIDLGDFQHADQRLQGVERAGVSLAFRQGRRRDGRRGRETGQGQAIIEQG